MRQQRIVVLHRGMAEELAIFDPSLFLACYMTDLSDADDSGDALCDLVLIDHSFLGADLALPQALAQQLREWGLPYVLRGDVISLEQKIQALENGFDDVICGKVPDEEITTRLLSVIYHNIANRQLQQRFQHASDTAFAAMRENSNLGLNIQFLISAHQCSNLDALGQAFFAVVEHYGVHCSLQMRSAFGVKNMEANGMARTLESELLSQLQGVGRYYDFGKRTVVNYGTVSLLIKNMPDDPVLYGQIKDNTFTLIQGLDARVLALDEHLRLEQEKQTLQSLSVDTQQVMAQIEHSYHAVMLQIVNLVEGTAQQINDRVPAMLLSEDHEAFLLGLAEQCVVDANQIFANGLRVDEVFQQLLGNIKRALEAAQQAAEQAAEQAPPQMAVSTADVELF